MSEKQLSAVIRVNVTPEQHEALGRIAERDYRSLAAVVRRAIREFLEREKEAAA